MYGVPTFFKPWPRHRARILSKRLRSRASSGILGLFFPYAMVYGVPTFFKPWLTFQSFLREMVYNGLNSGTPELVHLIPRCTKIGVPIGTPVYRIIIPDEEEGPSPPGSPPGSPFGCPVGTVRDTHRRLVSAESEVPSGRWQGNR